MLDPNYADLHLLTPPVAVALSILIGRLWLDDWLDDFREGRRWRRGDRTRSIRLRDVRWKVREPADVHRYRLLGTAIEPDPLLKRRLTAAGRPVARTGKECDYCAYRWNPVLTTGVCPSCGYEVGRMLPAFVAEEGYSLGEGTEIVAGDGARSAEYIDNGEGVRLLPARTGRRLR